MTMAMTSGMNVQVSSRTSEPWIGAPTSSAVRRRKRTAKTTISVAMSTEKKAVTATKNRYSASTLAACVEPCGGKNGRYDSIAVRTWSAPFERRRDVLLLLHAAAVARSRRHMTVQNASMPTMKTMPPACTRRIVRRPYVPVVGS